MGEFYQQQAISRATSRENQAYSAITGVIWVMAFNDSPVKSIITWSVMGQQTVQLKRSIDTEFSFTNNSITQSVGIHVVNSVIVMYMY